MWDLCVPFFVRFVCCVLFCVLSVFFLCVGVFLFCFFCVLVVWDSCVCVCVGFPMWDFVCGIFFVCGIVSDRFFCASLFVWDVLLFREFYDCIVFRVFCMFLYVFVWGFLFGDVC